MFSQIINFLEPTTIVQTVGLFGIFFIVFAETGLFFGFFFPGDSLLFTAGFLASQGFLDVHVLAVGAFICAVLGDSFGYYFGQKIGPKIFIKEDSLFFKKSYGFLRNFISFLIRDNNMVGVFEQHHGFVF